MRDRGSGWAWQKTEMEMRRQEYDTVNANSCCSREITREPASREKESREKESRKKDAESREHIAESTECREQRQQKEKKNR